MNAIEIITAWNSKTPEQQYSFCENCVKKAIKAGRTLKPGYDMDDAVQSTFEKVLERLANVDRLEADCKRRESQGKTPNTLAAVICRAANSVMERIAYHAKKHSEAISRTITTEDGQELDLLESLPSLDDTEATAILRAELERFIFSRDETDRQIIGGKMDDLTEREISAIVGISNVAVHKQIVKLQTALRAIIL